MRKLTEQEFLCQLDDKIVVLGEYKNSRDRIRVECRVCKHQWEPVANSLMRGAGCPICGMKVAADTKKWHISQAQFLEKIPAALKSKIDVLGMYVSIHDPLLVSCKVCNTEWSSSPYKLYKGQGCGVCQRKIKGIASRKTHCEFSNEIEMIHYGTIELLESYKTGKHRIKVRCTQCTGEWSPVAGRLRRRGCPFCISSKGERKIERLLEENEIDFKRQFSFSDLPRYRFDFAIFRDGKIDRVIEYDGEQHFRPVKAWGGQARYERQIVVDSCKDEFCKTKGLRLVRIPYTKYKDINLEMVS